LIDRLNVFSAEWIQAASCSRGNVLGLGFFRIGFYIAFFVFKATFKGYRVGLGFDA